MAVKADQPGLMGEIEAFFADPMAEIASETDVDKGHGRVEERKASVAPHVDWLDANRRFPDEDRFPDLRLIAKVEGKTWDGGKATRAIRFYVSSRAISPKDLADAVRSRWAIETNLHWVLYVTFGGDKARSHIGNGPANMAIVRESVFNIVRNVDDKRSLKLRRNKAARNPDYMALVLGQTR